MNPIYVSKNLAAASSTGIGTISSAGVATLNTSNLGTQRRVTIWSTGATLASASFTVTGTQQGGFAARETITGPTSNVAVATTVDFLTVTSVSASSVISNQATIGTNTTGGTPWQPVNLHVTPINIGAAMVVPSTAISAQIDVTLDDPWAPSPPPPGGLATSFNAVPVAFQSTHWQTITANNWDGLNVVVNPGAFVPITAWRLTITSTSSAVGTVNLTVVQAGIG